MLLALIVAMAIFTHYIALAGLQVINGPDIKIHFRWAQQFAVALSEGVIYPRWAAYSYFGLGDPTFLYIHPLFYYAVAAFDTFANNIWLSILGVGALDTAVTALAIYWVARKNANEYLAILAAGAAAISPYAFHLAHYQQFLPMHFAMPALVMFIGTVWSSDERSRIPATAIFLALLVGSHILAAFMALICTGVVIVSRALLERATARKLLIQHALGVVLGLGLSAIYLLPAMTTQHLVSPAGWYAPIHLDWRNAFLLQYFTLPEFGFRWFHLQWTVPVLTVLACGSSGYFLWLARATQNVAWRRASEMLALAVLALLLGSELSYPVWEHIGFFRRIQFPLRFLQIASIASVLAIVWSASLHTEGRKKSVWLLVGGFLLASITMLIALERQYAIEAKPALSVAAPSQAYSGQPEMKPAGVGEEWRRYRNHDAWQDDCKAIGITCSQPVSKTHYKIWVIGNEGVEAKSLKLPVLSFPGWRFQLNGTAVVPTVDTGTGLPEFLIPPGQTTISAIWNGLPQENIGLVISIGSLIVIGYLLIGKNRFFLRKGADNVA